MGVSKRPKTCQFCEREGVRFAVLATDQAGKMPRYLCAEHYAVLEQAGARGRVHGPSGVRWWLASARGG